MTNNRHKRKFQDFVMNISENINQPKILEFGVSERGMSTEFFINLCENKDGKVISIDANNKSKKFDTKVWTFINTRDDNFIEIEKFIKNEKFDIIYLDTIHKANHVEKIFYHYYKFLKKDGYFFIDDTSSLPYIKSREKNSFSQEINNQETFYKILEIFNQNHETLDLEFSFVGTGIAKIKKLSNDLIKDPKKIDYRENSIKNFLRKIVLTFLNLIQKNTKNIKFK